MTNPQEDAELRDTIGLWKWGGDFHRYIYGDSLDKPSGRAIAELDYIMQLIKARDEQRGKISVNRVEVIDHTDSGEGRVFTKWTEGNYQVELSEQDDGRTLKIFFTNPQEQDKEEEQMCECSFKGSQATPILMKLCNYHKRILKTKGVKALLEDVGEDYE